MKKLIYLIVAIAVLGLIVSGCIPVVPPTEQGDLSTLTKTVPPVWVDDDYCDGCSNDGHTWGTDAFATIQEGVDAVAAGGTVNVAAGTYYEQINISKSLSIIGVSKDNVTIDAFGAPSGYGISVTAANNVTLMNFILKGPPTYADGYGIHTSGCNNITFENLLVENSGRSGVDFIGCSNVTINNVEAKNNGGAGIVVTDSSDVVVNNITTSGNTWAGMAVFTYGKFYTGGCDNIALTGTNSFGEPGPFYTETGNFSGAADYPITNLNVSNDFQYIMRFPLSGPQKTAFFPTLDYALGAGAFAVFSGAADAVVNDVIIETPLVNYGTYYVGPGMIIQSAINDACSGNTIIVAAGTYTQWPIKLNKNGLTLRSSDGATVTFIDFTGIECGYWGTEEGGVDISHGTSGVTVEGFTVMGSSNASDALISVGGNNNVIRNNIVIGDPLSPGQDIGIHIGDVPETSVDWPSGNEILDNEIYNHAGSGIFVGNWAGANNIVSGNVVHDNAVGTIAGMNGNGIELDRVLGVTVTNNIVYNNEATGIKVIRTISNAAIEINFNSIYSNEIGVISTKWYDEAISSATLSVNCNNIYDNTEYGVKNTMMESIDATCNWWGTKSGPKHTTLNTTGTGDAVSDNVKFCPWALDNTFITFITLTLSPPDPQPISSTFDLVATLNNSTLGVSIDVTINGYIYSGSTDANGIAEINVGHLEVGVYNVSAFVRSMPECLHAEALLAVYDPTDGFVTGGGWIYSPAGAYVTDSSAEGKASFGFVSKYKKGATVPTGNTEFQFKAGDLNFHSDSYDWLVVTGSDYAMFKGTGTINGSGEYKFRIWARDVGKGGDDTFRIKIWEEDEGGLEDVVYDNGMDQVIDSGSIVVHTK